MSDEYKRRWLDFITDPKTVIGFLGGALTAAAVAGTWIFQLVNLDLKKLQRLTDIIEVVTPDTIVFKTNRDLVFKSGIFIFQMQPEGNFTIYESDSSNIKNLRFGTKNMKDPNVHY